MEITQDILSHKTLYLESQKEVFDLMDGIFCIEKHENLGENLAYCTQNIYQNNQYEVHINNIYWPAINCLKVHEFGHILFSHLRGADQKEKMIKHLLVINWPKISKYFDKSMSMEAVVDWFASKLNNVLMDFEVNSKLFTKEEFETFKFIVDDTLITYYQYEMANKPTIENKKRFFNIYQRKTKDMNDHLASLCWPEDVGFPIGKDYEEYVVLAIQNLDKFIDGQVKSIMKAITGNDYSDADFSENTDYIPESYITHDKSTEEVNKKPATANQSSTDDNSLPSKTKSPIRGTAHGSGSTIECGHSVADITSFIHKHAFVYEKERSRRDMLHHFNKGRCREANILLGYNKRQQKYHKASVVILIDVSGSVNKQSVENTLAALQFLKNDFIESSSHIISWDTHLVKDSYWMDMQVKYSGFGTRLAPGISYSKKYITKKTDKLFIISDFADNLQEWSNEFKNYPGERYGILISNNEVNAPKLDYLKDSIGFTDLFYYLV